MIGNALVVARLLHVAIFYARAAGLATLTNEPYDERLRQKYERMGFENGERLPLDNHGPLTQAFTYIEDVYTDQKYSLALTLPPLPL